MIPFYCVPSVEDLLWSTLFGSQEAKRRMSSTQPDSRGLLFSATRCCTTSHDDVSRQESQQRKYREEKANDKDNIKRCLRTFSVVDFPPCFLQCAPSFFLFLFSRCFVNAFFPLDDQRHSDTERIPTWLERQFGAIDSFLRSCFFRSTKEFFQRRHTSLTAMAEGLALLSKATPPSRADPECRFTKAAVTHKAILERRNYCVSVAQTDKKRIMKPGQKKERDKLRTRMPNCKRFLAKFHIKPVSNGACRIIK